MNRQARHHLGEVLMRQTGGSIVLLISDRESKSMVKIGDQDHPQSLYGFTCVFSWCLDILRQATCLVTDSTWCLKPYSLAILHAIIGNSSCPVGLSVSPTEQQTAYSRIYDHIDEIIHGKLLGSSPSFRSEDGCYFHPPEPADDPFIVEAGKEFEERERRADELDDGSSEINEGFKPDRFSDDETDEETGAPKPFCEGPYPFAPAKIPDFDPNILRRLPLVTDMGTALGAFVKKYNIEWKLCHRHILESVGARTRVGRWVSRLLRCHCEAKYQSESKRIRAQIERHGGAQSFGDNIRKLLVMLGDKIKGFHSPLEDPKRWRRDFRFGCPTTSNSAEGLHKHLNKDTRGRKNFFTRLDAVIRHLVTRYTRRFFWVNDALKRNWGLCCPPVIVSRGQDVPPEPIDVAIPEEGDLSVTRLEEVVDENDQFDSDAEPLSLDDFDTEAVADINATDDKELWTEMLSRMWKEPEDDDIEWEPDDQPEVRTVTDDEEPEDDPDSPLEKMERMARMKFYCDLHTAAGQDHPGLRQFPLQDPHLTIMPIWVVRITSLSPPDGWEEGIRPGRKKIVSKSSEPPVPDERRELLLNLDGFGQTIRGSAGLEIALRMRRRLGEKAWHDIGASMVPAISAFAELLDIRENQPIYPRQLRDWRWLSYQYAYQMINRLNSEMPEGIQVPQL
jgi:hypothetical protein